jgi:hypothetical protein
VVIILHAVHDVGIDERLGVRVLVKKVPHSHRVREAKTTYKGRGI